MDEPSRPTHRLEELIQEQGVVVKRVAEACQVDYSTMHRWRRGMAPLPSEKLPVLADFFGVSVVYLMGWDRDEQKEQAA